MRNFNKIYSALTIILGLTINISLPAQNWLEIVYPASSDGSGYDNFGQSVSVSGEYAIIGAPMQNSDASGNNPISEAGAAYIFKRELSGSWTEVQKIVASDRSQSDYFGDAVCMSGNYAIIGAHGADKDNEGSDSLYNAGAAYIFKKDANGTWTQVQRITADERDKDDWFGYSVSIAGDYAIVGAYQEDHNAVEDDSMNMSGSAYIFFKDQGGTDNWSLQKKIVASDRKSPAQFGYSVSISGNYVIAGARYETTDASGLNSLTNAGAAYIYNKDKNGTNNWGQVRKIVPTDREISDRFGNSVSISGNYAIAGADMEDHNENGDTLLSSAGSAYIFNKYKNGTDVWGQVQKLAAGDREAGDAFGSSVSLSGDYAIVGAPWEDPASGGSYPVSNAGSSYIFIKDAGGVWTQEQKIIPTLGEMSANDYCGSSVCITPGIAIAGAPGKEKSLFVWKSIQANNITFNKVNVTDATLSWENGTGASRAVFMREGSTGNAAPENNMTYDADVTYGLGAKIGTSDWYCIYNGTGNSAVVNGLTENTQYRVMVCEYVGTAGNEVYEDTTLTENPVNFTTIDHTWNETESFASTASSFGISVSISGNSGIVGTDYHEAAYIYEKDENGKWIMAQQISASDSAASDRFGYSVNISDDKVIIGAQEGGAAYIFKRNETSGVWTEMNKIVPDSGIIGTAGGISGDYAIAGRPGWSMGSYEGIAYIFKWDGYNWNQTQKIIPDDIALADDDAGFGYSVSISGDYAIIGAPYEDNDTTSSHYVWFAGAAYIFKRDGSNWVQDQKIFAPDRQDMDYFGISVSISGDHIIVGAYYEDHDQNGSNNKANAGSAYIFKRNGVTGKWEYIQKIVNGDRHEGDLFGISVSVSNDYILIGAEGESHDLQGNNFIERVGSAYLFKRIQEQPEEWEQFAKIVPGDRLQLGLDAHFGGSVSLSDENFIVGAPPVKKVYLFSNKIQAGEISASPGSREMTIDWVPGNGVKRVVFVKETETGYPFPMENTTYSADSVFGNGDQAGSDSWYCVYNGSGNTVSVTGLDPATQYRIAIFEYNGAPGSEEYYTGTANNNPVNITTGIDLTGIGINIASGIITGTTTNMQYSMNSTNGTNGDWNWCVNGNTTVTFIPGDLYVRQADLTSNFYLVSTIPPPDSPPAYTIDFYLEKTAQSIPNTVEYNYDNNFSTPNSSGDGTALALTPGQDVYFRFKATQSTLPSMVQALVVPDRPVVPDLSINFSAETTNESIPQIIEYNDDNDFGGENNQGSGMQKHPNMI